MIDMLKALNADISFDPNSPVPICVYRPYSVIELSRKLSSYTNLFLMVIIIMYIILIPSQIGIWRKSIA